MNTYIAGGVALVILILSWQLKAALTDKGELKAKLETQVSETLECVDANNSTMLTIRTLREEIEDMIEERRVDTERREQVLVEREQQLLRLSARAAELERERDNEIAENQDCADLASLEVGRFCPATAEQLRQRSRGEGGNGDTDG